MGSETTSSVNHATEVAVDHRPERHRFEAHVDGHVAVLDYLRVGDSLVFTHTEVPEQIEGRGIGSALARAGLEYVRDHDLVAAPLCPFVREYIRRHSEYRDLVGFGARGDRVT